MDFARNLLDVSYLSNRPIPLNSNNHVDLHSPQSTAIDNVALSIRKNPLKALANRATIAAFLDAAVNPDSIDDRKGVFQAGLEILSSLDPASAVARQISDNTINTLYNTVPHPPASLLGDEHNFRRADGGGNSLQNPDCGRAGMPYARSVQCQHPLPATSLPDPGLVFDTLLCARGPRQEHPGGNASFTFAFASIVTHSLFRTNHADWSKNETSSYLDLSPLYGHDQARQDAVRDKAQGRGLLYPDTFSEERLLFLPPAPCALLVIFNRNHNYIADTLLKINERKQWSDPPPSDPAARARQDEQLFQTARLVNCGHFMSLILGDYAAGFLGLSEGNFWDIKAFDPIKLKNGDRLPRGEGNHVSVEFNMMYRWHATLSGPDATWTEDMFARVFRGKAFDQLTTADFLATARDMQRTAALPPNQRVFGGLARDPATHRFPDDGVAALLQNATLHAGCAYGARGTPAVLRVIEVMGIEQARSWGVCTMNEFRHFLGLKVYASFLEWNPVPEIAAAAERLYGHIDNLELYTGLQAEQIMPLTGGSRLSAGYSTTRAVLGDAIAMIRGDRFYTTDYTPGNLTAWGFQDCVRDPNNGGFGGEMPKLLMRHLPRHYPYDSVYSLFPYFTPRHMLVSLTRQGLADKYRFAPPAWARVPVVLNTLAGIRVAFGAGAEAGAAKAFRSVYDVRAVGGAGAGERWGEGVLVLGPAGPVRIDGEKALALEAVFPGEPRMCGYDWYGAHAAKLIAEKTWHYDGAPGAYVDIVAVINALSVRWAAEFLCGLPLKTADNPAALFTDLEVYDMFTTLYNLVFLSVDAPERKFALCRAADEAGGALQTLLSKTLAEAAPAPQNPLTALFTLGAAALWPGPGKACHPFLQRVARAGTPRADVLAAVLGYAVAASVNYAHAAVLAVDFYLDARRARERTELAQLAARADATSDELLRGYAREAMRLNPACTGLYRDVVGDALVPQGAGKPPVALTAGDRVWASFKNAHLNPEDFPDPQTVDPRRPPGAYHFPGTDFQTAGGGFAEQAVAQAVRAVFSLADVRRADGDAGRLLRFEAVANETARNVYLAPDGTTSAFPGPMHIVYGDAAA